MRWYWFENYSLSWLGHRSMHLCVIACLFTFYLTCRGFIYKEYLQVGMIPRFTRDDNQFIA